MKVNGNDPTHTTVLGKQRDFGDFGKATAELFPDNHSNIPIRLEIASRIAAGLAADPNFAESCSGDYANLVSQISFEIADRLIAKHNETCGGDW